MEGQTGWAALATAIAAFLLQFTAFLRANRTARKHRESGRSDHKDDIAWRMMENRLKQCEESHQREADGREELRGKMLRMSSNMTILIFTLGLMEDALTKASIPLPRLPDYKKIAEELR